MVLFLVENLMWTVISLHLSNIIHLKLEESFVLVHVADSTL